MNRARRRWRNANLVREQDSHSLRELWLWAAICAAALSPMAFYLLEQMQYARVQSSIEDLRTHQKQYAEQERRLLIERSSLHALPNVERESAKLGLIYPDAQNRIQVLEASSGEGRVAGR